MNAEIAVAVVTVRAAGVGTVVGIVRAAGIGTAAGAEMITTASLPPTSVTQERASVYERIVGLWKLQSSLSNLPMLTPWPRVFLHDPGVTVNTASLLCAFDAQRVIDTWTDVHKCEGTLCVPPVDIDRMGPV